MILAADHFGPDTLLISCVVFHRRHPIVPKIVQYVQQRLSLNGSDDGAKIGFTEKMQKSAEIPRFQRIFGARAHFRTRSSGSGKAASPKHWHDQLLQYLFSTHHKTNSPLEALFFCVFGEYLTRVPGDPLLTLSSD